MNQTKLVLFLAVVLAAVVTGWCARGPGPPPPPPPLPPDAVVVEVVREIEGPERVVERVSWRTREVPVPVETLREIVRECPGSGELPPPRPGDAPGDLPPITGRILIDASKHVGQVGDTVKFGWTGSADCEISVPHGPWLPVVSQPIAVEGSWVQSTVAPVEPSRALYWPRWELRLGVGSDRAAVVGVTWHPWNARRFLRRAGFWGEYQRVDTLPDGWPASLGESRTERGARLAGGVALRW